MQSGLEAELCQWHSLDPLLLVPLENHPNMAKNIWCEQIDPTVDNVTYKSTGFLHKMEHLKEMSDD